MLDNREAHELIVKAMRRVMLERELTQTAVAERMDMDRSALSRRMTGQSDFTITELVRFCRVTGTTASSILGGIK